MAIKKWCVPKENIELAKILADECQISELAASILVNRGHKSFQKAQQFLMSDELSSPFDLKDMQKAVNRIHQAINDEEKIAIYGDYDCDGVTSTAMLYTYLSSIGADAIYYIPERDGEGYGLNKTAIKSLADNQVSLIITVDNGISAIDEIDYANLLGVDVVVTDHHQPSETLPNAVAIVNPHQKDCKSSFKELCGAGVAFKLIVALEDGDYQTALDYFSDIVAIGTIGDIVPLKDENRALVKNGLQMLKLSENIGLQALIEVCNINKDNISAQTVAFTIVPRINAAGRMGSASLAVRLLLSEDPQEALEHATKLDQFNKQRQEDEKTIINDIEHMIMQEPKLLTQRVLMLYHSDWNHGILGIVCSKLLERYGKPCLLMTSDDGTLKGSARSLGEFHLFKALSANAKHLLQYGGHKLATGFSLKESEYENFKQGLESYAKEHFDLMPQYQYQIDKVLHPNELTVENLKSLEILQPFGSKNEQPLFLIRRATIQAVTPISNDKHQRITLHLHNTKLTALCFGKTSNEFIYKSGDIVDVLFHADINEYNQTLSVTLKIKDIRPSGFAENKFFAAKGYYEKIIKNEQVAKNILSAAVPNRDEIAKLYKLLKSNDGYENNIDDLYCNLLNLNINYCKMRIILDILNELGLIALSPMLNGIKMSQVTSKVDLAQAPLLKRLTSKI